MPPINVNTPDDPNQEWSASFWSYVHRDNSAMFNKIDMLRDDLKAIYSVETGETLKIFVDRESIGWGEQWEEVLEAGIGSTVFMMPIVTANYFNSEACRTELLTFYSHCRARGLLDLILPIVLTGKGKVDKESTDEVARIIAKSQYEDFSEVWPLERGGERWTTSIRTLVKKLVAAEARVETRLLAALTQEVHPEAELSIQNSGGSSPIVVVSKVVDDDEDEDEDDAPGLLEVIEQLEPSIEESTTAIVTAAAKFNEVSEILKDFGEESQSARGDSKKYKLTLINLAESMRGPAHEFEVAASDALDKVTATDSVIKLMYSMLETNFTTEMGEQLKAQFTGAIDDENVAGVRSSIETLDDLIIKIADAEKISAITKKSLRPARRGVRYMRDAGRQFLGWWT